MGTSGRKPTFFCVPYRDHEFTMVYAGTQNPKSDGYIIVVSFDEDGRPLPLIEVIDGERSES